MSERDVQGPGGRTLHVHEAGDPDGVAVLFLHGSPGCGLPEPDDVARAERRGIRLLGYDRPGYGGSSRQDGRTVAGCAADVRAIADALGVDRLAVWGVSGGGPHAAACAALLPGLVPAVALLCSIAPYGAPGLDFFSGMGEANVEDTRLQLEDPVAARARAEEQRDEILDGGYAGMLEILRTLLCSVDKAALSDELGTYVQQSMTQGLAPSVDGWWDDNVAHLGDWGFDLAGIDTPVLVQHGEQDAFVPVAHGRWLAAAIPGAEARIHPDEGHISLTVNRLEESYDWLLERMS